MSANTVITTRPVSEAVRHQSAAAVGAVLEAASHPFYHWFFDLHRVDVSRVRCVESFREFVPIVRKRDYVEFQGLPDFALQPSSRQIHLTSGTSGAGREVHQRDSRDVASLGTGGAYAFLGAGLRRGDRFMLTFPFTQTMAGPFFHASCLTAGLVPIDGAGAGSSERLAMLDRFGVAGISLTPSYLHRMTSIAREQGVDPRRDLPHLRAIFLSGESYGLDWAAEAGEFWGVTLHEMWGATQTLGTVMLTEPPGVARTDGGRLTRGELLGLDHRVLLEVLDEDGTPVADGEEGEIVVTTFRSFGTPSIRFGMGDGVRLIAALGSDGNPRSRYECGSIRRLDDMIKVKGTNIWPSAVDQVVLDVSVVDYRAIVTTTDDGREVIEISIETAAGVSPDDRLCASVAERVRHKIGLHVRVRPALAGGPNEQDQRNTTFKARRWTDQRVVRSGEPTT